MKSILIANRKGGCGKTMVAVTIASAIAARGGVVGLADADPQKSSLRWLKHRPDTATAIRPVDWTDPDDFGDAPKKLDWLVIDAPGALYGERAEALIAEAKAIITPVLPSIFDVDSTKRFLKEIEHVKRVRKGKVDVNLIANRTRGGRGADRLGAFFERLGQEPLAWISERTAYPELAAQGLAVFDKPQKLYEPLRAQWAPVMDALD